ncbi:MAG: RIP metalloprotease RseP [Pontiellaceae bacterium]|nr:RIP metalloprotease RseP [Pontiellaceae bacterium]MBN2785550.1 RIP metalloprotease RseP [Pontiellaceae bacterium]
MLTIIYIIIMMLLLFGVTIFVHEWGHFIVARKLGLVAETFSIGMGPALWKKEINGVVYKIGAFPIGGYVSLPQLDPEGMEKMQGDNESDRAELPEVSPWKKIAVSVAGPLCNVIFALFLAGIVYLLPAKGIIDENGVFVADVAADSAAYASGLRGGDQIKAVNGTPVKSWYEAKVESMLKMGEEQTAEMTVFNATDGERTIVLKVNDPKTQELLIDGTSTAVPCEVLDIAEDSPAGRAGLLPRDVIYAIDGIMVTGTEQFTKIVQSHPGDSLTLRLLRGNEPKELNVVPEDIDGTIRIGIGFRSAFSLPWTMSGNPIEQVTSDATSIFRFLKALTTPSEAKQAAEGAGGPVAILKMLYQAIYLGMVIAIGLTRFININLAVLNLLPIPVLDGGHICFSLWEGITRRKVPAKVVTSLVNIFAILLIGLMILLSWRDIGGPKLISRFKKAPQEQVQPDAGNAEIEATPSVPAE